MNTNYWTQDLDSVKALYAAHVKEFEDSLLAGVEWKELEAKRRLITELSIVIDRRMKSVHQDFTKQ